MSNAVLSRREIYLDNNATTRPLPEVRNEVLKMLGDDFGNPSSLHSTGERARKKLSGARHSVASLLGAESSDIIFTSSGTEANNLVLYSCFSENPENCYIVTTCVEHSSIRKMCSFLGIKNVNIRYLPVDINGHLRLEELEKALEEEPCMVSVQWVNNETGVIQDISSIMEMCREYGVLFHTDAAQAVGKIRFRVSEMPVDYLTFTGHKFHSPQGCGGVYVKDKLKLHPFLFGGFQEEGFRPGTENLPGIVGMGKASEIRNAGLDSTIQQLGSIRDMFESRLLDFIPGTRVNGDTGNRVCNTTNIMFSGIDGRKLVKMLDEHGVRCSQSSACTNFDPSPSYVLKAMGFSDEQVYSSIRFSFGVNNTEEDVHEAVEIIRECCGRLGK